MFKRVFDHVLIIMFENQYRGYVMQNPYFRLLARVGIEMRNYYGVMHPSQTNYITSIAGELCNVSYDDAPPPLSQQTIVDLIESSPLKLRWRAYMDSYIPQNQPWTHGLKPKDEYPYVIKHNPFSSFANIQTDKQRWSKIGNEADFWSDLINNEFPEYAWFTPNMWNDGHYLDGTQTSPHERAPLLVDQAALWLEGFFARLRFPGPDSHLPEKTLVVVTFDEADYEADWEVGKEYTYDGPNQVYTVLLGDCVTSSVQMQAYNHYSLLHTIERNFDLGHLGKNDAAANCFEFLWGRQFAWSAPQQVPFASNDAIVLAEWNRNLCALYKNADNYVQMRMYLDYRWTDAWNTGLQVSGDFVLTSVRSADDVDEWLLAYVQAEGGIAVTRYTASHGWQKPTVLECDQSVRALAITAYDNGVMLVWSEADGALYSRVCVDQQWQAIVEVGHNSDSDVQLAAIGASIYLFLYNAQNQTINVVSYNTATYNAVTHQESQYDGPWNNTVTGCWSKDVFPVGRYGTVPNRKTPGEPEPVAQPYSARLPMAVAELNGVIHLLHLAVDNAALMTETFSLAGIMTAELPISYNEKESKTTSNGYGTLAQAGWSAPQEISGAYAKDACLSACRCDERVYMLYRSDGDGGLSLVKSEW